MSLTLLFGSALLLGSAHAFGPDHVAAVTVFALRRPDPHAALSFGMRWAAGHGFVVFCFGAALAVAGSQLPPTVEVLAERAVGWTLVAMGLWAVGRARAVALAARQRDTPALSPALSHAPTAVGMLHGLAGIGAVVGLMPVATVAAPVRVAAYLFAFAFGTALAMAMYAFIAGLVLRRTMQTSADVALAVARTAGVITLVIGLFWVSR